jgi:hypothetical protein
MSEVCIEKVKTNYKSDGFRWKSYLDITNYVKVVSGSNGTSCVMWVDRNDCVVFEK